MRGKRRFFLLAAALFLGGLGLRLWFVLRPDTLDGDSAVFAIMAQRIMERGEGFVFMPFNHYAGALAAYIGALLFKLFGVSTVVFNFTGLILSLAWAAVTCTGAFLMSGLPGLAAAGLLTFFAPYRVMLFSLYPGGVQAETILFGSMLILFAVLKQRGVFKTDRFFFIFAGLVCGVGFWQTPGMIPFIAAVFFLTRKGHRAEDCLVFFSWFLVGYLPALVYNVQHHGATFLRLAGRALDMDRQTAVSTGITGVFAGLLHKFSGFPAGIGRAARLFISLAGPVHALILAAGLILYAKEAVRGLRKGGSFLPVLFASVAIFLLYYSFFIQEPAERFMLALYVPLPFLAARMAADLSVRVSVVVSALACGALAAVNLFSYVPDAGRSRGGGYAGLARHLAARKISHGFSDYWTAYPVIFESGGTVILSPTLFHPDYSERFPEYTERVRDERESAFIVNDELYPHAAGDARRSFAALGVSCESEFSGSFTVFYGLSRKVTPEELDMRR